MVETSAVAIANGLIIALFSLSSGTSTPIAHKMAILHVFLRQRE